MVLLYASFPANRDRSLSFDVLEKLGIEAIEAGKHVLVEKPLGTSIEECRVLRDRLSRTKLVLQIGNNRRFDPGISFARRFIQDELGEMMALKAWYCDSTYRYTMTDNLQPIIQTSRAAQRPAGNPKDDKRRYFLLTHGSHLVDTARFLGGPIRQARVRWLCRRPATRASTPRGSPTASVPTFRCAQATTFRAASC